MICSCPYSYQALTLLYEAENLVAVSRDGLHWGIDPQARWGGIPWHPDPPINCFYDKKCSRYIMTTRSGWGDRRIALQSSEDGYRWIDLDILMQPDVLDMPQTEFYGMPVFCYEGIYLGFLWVAHFSNSQRIERLNQLTGSLDTQLTYSFDGKHFQRCFRKPFIPLNEPGLPGSGIIYPTCLIDTGDELRIYSSSSMDLHFQKSIKQFVRKEVGSPCSILMHKLRKDGFQYIASKGNWGTFCIKPFMLTESDMFINVQAPHGDVLYRVLDFKNKPVEGYDFENCDPIHGDCTHRKLEWSGQGLNQFVGKIMRLEFMLRNARIYAVRGNFHFIDALDYVLIEDGRSVDTDVLDY